MQYDTIINDWHTCPASGRINASNPCSEYMFLDDTACNLASLNFTKFYDTGKGKYDIPALKHATRLWTTVLEISVAMAQYPSESIAQGSHDFRTLGLGYANLGTCLMLGGIPYDSAEARAVCGALTALMTGESYATSAELAAAHGPFPRYKENAKHMLRVMRNHRRAAYNAKPEEYEGLSVAPVGIDSEYCPDDLLKAARESWDRAVELGKQYGYRNAQTTVIAPTGTIGLLMDCDTTGIEPDFALVKFKKLAGGGYFKIVNQSVEPALRQMGYDEKQTKAIIAHIVGTLSLKNAPAINESSLKAKGFTDIDLSRVESALQGALELKQALSPWVLGEEALKRLNVSVEESRKKGFNLALSLGFSHEDYVAANNHICGHQTIEGAPLLRQEHLPVFDCANRCGPRGERFIHHMGHVRMMAAAQPFISGAISKTINMPNEVNLEDVKDSYLKAYDLGLKAVALYRDGCKLSQPLSVSKKEEKKEAAPEAKVATVEPAPSPDDTVSVPIIAKGQPATLLNRRPMPKHRRGSTYEVKIGGQKMYLRTGEYDDGQLGEIFLDMSKEGATLRSFLNCFAIAISKGLQYGVPLEEFVNTFIFSKFEPQGVVSGHPYIKTSTSVVDLVFRILGHQYGGRTDFLHVKPTEISNAEKGPALLADKGVGADLGVAGEANPDQQEIDFSNPKQPAASDVVAAGASAPATPAPAKPSKASLIRSTKPKDALSEHLESLMGDAPMCDVCGHITVRNGACYKCLNCGNSMGCS